MQAQQQRAPNMQVSQVHMQTVDESGGAACCSPSTQQQAEAAEHAHRQYSRAQQSRPAAQYITRPSRDGPQQCTAMCITCSWAARYNAWLLIKLTPRGVVFSFLFFSITSSILCTSQHMTHSEEWYCSPAPALLPHAAASGRQALPPPSAAAHTPAQAAAGAAAAAGAEHAVDAPPAAYSLSAAPSRLRTPAWTHAAVPPVLRSVQSLFMDL